VNGDRLNTGDRLLAALYIKQTRRERLFWEARVGVPPATPTAEQAPPLHPRRSKRRPYRTRQRRGAACCTHRTQGGASTAPTPTAAPAPPLRQRSQARKSRALKCSLHSYDKQLTGIPLSLVKTLDIEGKMCYIWAGSWSRPLLGPAIARRSEKGKPVVRWGRKAMGLCERTQIARLPEQLAVQFRHMHRGGTLS
jgi:hypothetical protein